jgi:hypothetical protein
MRAVEKRQVDGKTVSGFILRYWFSGWGISLPDSGLKVDLRIRKMM